VDNPLSAGPHKLIRDGATLVTNLEDILESLGPMPDAVRSCQLPVASCQLETDITKEIVAVEAAALSPSQQILLRHLNAEPTHVDRLVDLTQLPAGQILQDLTLLTLRGSVKRADGQHYVRARL
jgi:DNA processing protein